MRRCWHCWVKLVVQRASGRGWLLLTPLLGHGLAATTEAQSPASDAAASIFPICRCCCESPLLASGGGTTQFCFCFRFFQQSITLSLSILPHITTTLGDFGRAQIELQGTALTGPFGLATSATAPRPRLNCEPELTYRTRLGAARAGCESCCFSLTDYCRPPAHTLPNYPTSSTSIPQLPVCRPRRSIAIHSTATTRGGLSPTLRLLDETCIHCIAKFQLSSNLERLWTRTLQ